MTKNFCDICGKQLPGPAPKSIPIATKAGLDRNGNLEPDLGAIGTPPLNKPITLVLNVEGEYCVDCKRTIVTNLIPQSDMPGVGAKKFGS